RGGVQVAAVDRFVVRLEVVGVLDAPRAAGGRVERAGTVDGDLGILAPGDRIPAAGVGPLAEARGIEDVHRALRAERAGGMDDQIVLGRCGHQRTGGRPAVSSIRRTRRTSSSNSWTCGVKYLPDFYRRSHTGKCKRYVCAGVTQSLPMSSGIRRQPWELMPFAGKAIIPG